MSPSRARLDATSDSVAAGTCYNEYRRARDLAADGLASWAGPAKHFMMERLQTPRDPSEQSIAGSSLTMLPPELLFEIAVRSPLWSLRQVARFDIRLVSCVRIQRWIRSIDRRHQAALRVGNRVLVRLGSGCSRVLRYATAAAMMNGGSMWKVRMLNNAEFVSVPVPCKSVLDIHPHIHIYIYIYMYIYGIYRNSRNLSPSLSLSLSLSLHVYTP